MVYIHNSVSECKSMGSSANFGRNKKAHHNPNPSCNGFRSSAAVDIVILIAVISASGFLLYPYVKFISVWLAGAIGAFAVLVKEEVSEEPIIYFCITVGVTCSALAAFGLVMCFAGQKCDNPNCRGLRKAAEFDIQLETEDCVKGLSKSPIDDGLRTTGLFELPRDHHKELEAELKKMAPPNGRAVLLFRGRCGCAVGKMEVPGPRRRRKVK